MKIIVYAILFIMTFTFLCQCDRNDPSPNINIPDNNFLNALIELGVDKNGDGIISLDEAEGNQLTTLDVSTNTSLNSLYCDNNQLTDLDISNNTALDNVYIRDMPSLYMVCVWETPFPPDGIYIDSTNSPNVYFTADCN